jgi:hypothetical protein
MLALAKNRLYTTAIPLGIFGLAMGLLEAIAVVYLRTLYYPGGFDFPLQTMPSDMAAVELIRELCTIVMLLTLAWVVGKNRLQKFAWFIYTFAVWDIFYYVGLKLFLNWPPSLMAWDILFLIPVPWVSPVLAPIICSLTMILLAVSIVLPEAKGYPARLKGYEWALIFGGAIIILVSFIEDYATLFLKEGSFPRLLQSMTTYRPTDFNWPLFLLGEILILTTALRLTLRPLHTQK